MNHITPGMCQLYPENAERLLVSRAGSELEVADRSVEGNV